MRSVTSSIMMRWYRGLDDLPGCDAADLRELLGAVDPCRGDLDAAAMGRLAQLRRRIVSGQAVFSHPSAGLAGWRRQHGILPALRRASSPPGGRAAVAAAAVTVSCALAAGLVTAAVIGTGHPPGAPGRMALDAFLGRAATVARTQNTPLGRPGQIFYLKTLEEISAGLPGYPPAKSCQVVWDPPPSVGGTAGGDDTGIPARPAPRFCAGGVPAPPAGYPEPWFKDHGYASWDHNGYPPPESLPTAPAALLTALYQAAAHRAPPGGGTYWGTDPTLDPSRADIVFVLADRLLQAPISSQLRSALFAATARLPRVELIGNVADAAGRRGVEVALMTHESTFYPCATAAGFQGFILDPVTYRYLGERDVLRWAPGCHLPKGKSWPPGLRKAAAHFRHRPWVTYDVTAVLQTGFTNPARS
jgi:hypothetical protein